MEIFKSIKIFFKNRYSLLLILIVLLSYGQILWMQPWEDDQGLFIKMADLEANVGYFGRGPLGEGAYKYTAVPFIPIYHFFGTNSYAYFELLLVLYILATLVIYKIFSKIFGETAGRVTGFIFASGYIASDAIWRMTNGAATSISFILVSLFIYFYWKYYKLGKFKDYLTTVMFFFLSVQYFVVRDHYLIAIAVAFELLFLTFKNSFKSILPSIARMILFIIIFYYCVVSVGDARSGGALELVKSMLAGKVDLTYGFFSSVANLIIPDYLTKSISKYLPMLGMTIIILFVVLILKLKSNSKFIILFGIWILVNILAYWIYTPTVVYESVSRYLSHSFLPLSVLLGILYVKFGKKTKIVIIIFGILNIYNAIIYQHNFLINKSFPTKQFYVDLKTLLPKIEKGDVLYFDVAKKSDTQYKAAISAAMLPNSGSIAWRYDIYRYDFSLVERFEDLNKLVLENKIKPEKIHGFWYSNGKLIDISTMLHDYFNNKVKVQKFDNLNLPTAVNSTTPKSLEFTLTGIPDDPYTIDFKVQNSDEKLKKLSLNYVQEMNNFLERSKLTTNSFWQNNKTLNMFDSDLSTVWQSDRLEWQKRNDFLITKLLKTEEIDRVTWIGGTYAGSIPISYKVETSIDGTNWRNAKNVVGQKINTSQELQIVNFDSVYANFLKFTVSETLGGDSPMIAEFRVIPSRLGELDLRNATKFLENPFMYVSNELEFNNTLLSFKYRFPVKLYWYGNKLGDWSTSKATEINILFDGRPHMYKVTLPAGGTEITKLKISDVKIPSIINISDVKVY